MVDKTTMRQAKTPILFFVKSILVFGLLMGAWSWIDTGYAGCFRMVGNSIAGLGSGGSIWYAIASEDHRPHDIQLVLRNAEIHQQRGVYMSSRRLGYMPTVFLLALVLAYPMKSGRMGKALLWSVAWIHVWIVFVLMLYPHAYGDLEAAASDVAPSAGVAALQYVLEWVLSGSSAGWMLMPLLIWTLICFRKSDWAKFVEMGQPDPQSAKS